MTSVNETPLHSAVRFRNIEAVRLLLDQGIDIHVKDDNDATPLHLACGDYTSTEIVALLLDFGADANARDRFGETPLHKECCTYISKDNVSIVELLVSHKADVTAKDKEDTLSLGNLFLGRDGDDVISCGDDWEIRQHIAESVSKKPVLVTIS